MNNYDEITSTIEKVRDLNERKGILKTIVIGETTMHAGSKVNVDVEVVSMQVRYEKVDKRTNRRLSDDTLIMHVDNTLDAVKFNSIAREFINKYIVMLNSMIDSKNKHIQKLASEIADNNEGAGQ